MSLWDHLLALRIPSAVKSSPEEWDASLSKTVLPFLDSVPSKQLQAVNPDPLSSIISPTLDTLPYLYILYERLNATLGKSKTNIPQQALPGGDLWDKLATFITECDPVEIRYGGIKIRYLLEILPELAHFGAATQVPILQYMAALMLKLDPSCGTLTSSHIGFMRICMHLHAFPEALLILDHDIHSLPATESLASPTVAQRLYLSDAYISINSQLTQSITRHDVVEYYQLGAMAYIAMKQWSKASHFLEHILSLPTNNTATGPMLESYRKWILVNLMAKGRMPPVPKSVNVHIMRVLKPASKHYESLADSFVLEDGRKLAAEAIEAWSMFTQDGNAGLVRGVLDEHRKLSVSQLARIYAAVPLENVAAKLETPLADTEDYVSALINEGFLKAAIEMHPTTNEKVLRFFEEGKEKHGGRAEDELREELMRQTNKIKALSDHVREADRRISLTKEYLQHTQNSRQSKDKEGEGTLDEGEAGFGGRRLSEEDDENVMAP